MSTAVLDRMQALNRVSQDGGRISLTELARTSGWRKQLRKLGVMEVVDRTETEAFLVSRQGMADLLETIESLEDQIECAEVAALVSARADRQNWLAGEELVGEAWRQFEARRSQFEAVVNAD